MARPGDNAGRDVGTPTALSRWERGQPRCALPAVRERIFARNSAPWAGNWHLVIYQVPETARASRDRLRGGLTWLGFGPLAPSTWVSAHDRRERVTELFDGEQHARIVQLVARNADVTEDRTMAAHGCDLDRLAEDYRNWIAERRRGG